MSHTKIALGLFVSSLILMGAGCLASEPTTSTTTTPEEASGSTDTGATASVEVKAE